MGRPKGSKNKPKDAKAAPAAAATAKKTTPVKPSEVRETISANKLKSLMASARSVGKQVTEIAGGLGQQVKDAVENNHLDRKAFNVMRMADKMEPERLAEFLENLEDYFEKSGLNGRADSAQRLPLGDKKGEGEGEDENPNQGGSNVAAFPPPKAVAAE
jgi:hypothetical protein